MTAYDSIRAGFEDYLAHFNDGRPIIFIGHSQGSSMLILLLQHFVDNDAALRNRARACHHPRWQRRGAHRQVRRGSFAHIPVCKSTGEKGCVIAYSTFPGEPPATSLFGQARPRRLAHGRTVGKGGPAGRLCEPRRHRRGDGFAVAVLPFRGPRSHSLGRVPRLYNATCEEARAVRRGSRSARSLVPQTLARS